MNGKKNLMKRVGPRELKTRLRRLRSAKERKSLEIGGKIEAIEAGNGALLRFSGHAASSHQWLCRRGLRTSRIHSPLRIIRARKTSALALPVEARPPTATLSLWI